MVNVTSDNKKLKEEAKAATNSELKGKVKKLSEEIKEKNRKQEDYEKRMTDLMKKFGEETNLRAKAEAEVVRANKMIDYLHEIIEQKKEPIGHGAIAAEASKRKSFIIPRCLDQDKPTGCPFRDTCRYIHDEGRQEAKIQKTEDCSFWLEGSCRFTDQACRFVHDIKKKGSKPRQEVRRSMGATSTPFLGQGNHAANQSIGQPGAALQLVTAGGQVYLHQGGQVLQPVQPVLGLPLIGETLGLVSVSRLNRPRLSVSSRSRSNSDY